MPRSSVGAREPLKDMRLLVQLVLGAALFVGLSSARYHDKTRFDRSINHAHRASRVVDQKPRIFIDPESHYTAYKDAALSICYLEKTRSNELDDSKLWKDVVQNNRKELKPSTYYLKKIEAWRLVGGRIVEFCKGMKMVPLVERKPVILEHDPFFNELPEDENDVFEKRVSDVVLTPLKVRAKRQAILEEHLKHLQGDQQRKKREARKGQFRGQTQSQYMNVNGNKDGKAEAKADQQSSHAIVSGSSGMGQAQSMSMGSDCEGCASYTVPGSILSSMSGSGRGDASGGQTGTYPSGLTPGANSALNPGTIMYPGLAPGTPGTGGGSTGYPTGGVPGATVPSTGGQVGGMFPGSQTIPGQSIPSTQQGGHIPSVQAPGGSYPSGAVPQSQGSTPSGSGTNGGGGYPGTSTGIYTPQIPSGQQPGQGSVTYQMIPQQGSQTSQTGTVPQGSVPEVQPTDGRGYPPAQWGGGGPTNYIPPGTFIPNSQTQPGTSTPGAQVGNAYPPGSQGLGPPSIGSVVRDANGVQGILGPGGVIYYPSQSQWPGTSSGGSSYPPGPPVAGGGTPGSQVPGTGWPSSNMHPQNNGFPTSPQGSPHYPQNTHTMPGGAPQPSQGTYPLGTTNVGGPPVGQMNGGSSSLTQPGTSVVGGPQGIPPGTYSQAGSPYVPGAQSGGIFPGTTQGSGVYPPNAQYGGGSTSRSSVYSPETQQVGQTSPGINTPVRTGEYNPQSIPGGNSGATSPQNQIGGANYPSINTGFPGGITAGQAAPGYMPSLGQGVGQQPGINQARNGGIPGTFTPGGGQGTSYPSQQSAVGGTTYPNVSPSINSGSGTTTAIQTGPTRDTSKPITRGDIPGPSVYPGTQTEGYNQGFPNLVQGPSGQFPSPGQTGTYPGVTSGQHPGSQQYPGGGGAVAMPGQGSPSGTFPGAANTGIVTGQYPGGQQYPSGGAITIPGQAPVTGVVSGSNRGEVTATSQQSRGPPNGDEGDDSQALSSVKQVEGGTQASASAEGRHGTGSATSQVSGTYTGTGAFSAQAGTSDSNKSAQTQVSGGKEGARSSAQGSGGLGRSQVQVELDSDTGATSTSAQSGGWQHGTSSKVEASGQGGLADAQANGEGQTSSQAQIGFQPYHSRGDEKPNADRRDKPFRGGGTASAQSGTYRGQSQTQLQGSFHYGITYTGSSQASSGSGAAGLRKPFNFTTPDEFKPFKLDDNSGGTKKANKAQSVPKEHLRESSSRQTVIAINSNPRDRVKPSKQPSSTSNPVKSVDEDEEDDYEEYDDDELGTQDSQDRRRLPAPPTRQEVRVVTNGEHEISVRQREIPATTKTPVSGTRSLERLGGIVKPPGSEYVSVTNSVAGKIDSPDGERNQADEEAGAKKYEHRYYTKSSTCGYFTFSCNVVYGSNGRRKICKPKLPDASSKC